MPLVSYRNAVDCQFFVETDPYNYITDNRPLGNLLTDILELEAILEPLRDEVVQARTGLLTTFPSLDERLDDMEGSIGASVSVSEVEDLQNFQYIDALTQAEALRRASPSGFLDFGGIADLSVGDYYDDFAAIRTTEDLGDPYQNQIVMWNLFGGSYKPIRALVNGWIVRLFNENYQLDPGAGPFTFPANHVSMHLGSAPVTGKLTNFAFLEVWLEQIDSSSPLFYPNGAEGNAVAATADPLDPTVIHSVKAMTAGGDWIQLRHRIRLEEDIDIGASDIPHGFNSSIEAQGAESAPVAGYEFENMAEVIDDAGLWRAGDGDAQSRTDLGTYDGYVYAIPICMVHRRNSGNYAITNQNGSKKNGVVNSGYLTSEVSGHPAGLYYDAISERDILDLRHRVAISGFSLKNELDRSWQMLIRGELRTNWNQLQYDYDNDGTWTGAGVWGHSITAVDQIANAAEDNTNPLRDKQVTGAPLATPDGQRTFWSKNPAIQYIKFSFTQGNSGSVSPAGFVTYTVGTETLTFNASTLSGAGTGGTKIASTPPVIMKTSDLSSQPGIITSGLGTQSASAKMSNLSPAADYTGYIAVVYPGGSGVTYPASSILGMEVYDNGVTLYPDEQFGTTGTPVVGDTGLASPFGVARDSSGNYIVVDRNNHRVVKIDPTTWTKTAQFGVTGTSGADNSHTNSPTGVCVDSSDNIYFCDYGNHRIVKLNSSMTYVTQFGSTGVSGTALDRANHPMFVDTDDTYLYAADTGNHRVLKVPVSMASAVDSFGTAGTIGSGQFGLNTPIGIAVVNSGFGSGVWVADSGNKRVVVLDTSLTFQYQITDSTSRNTLLLHFIRDIVIDGSGNFYVTCGVAPGYGGGQGHCVYKYNSNLSLVGTFGTPGVPKSNNTGLNDAVGGGLAYDSVNNFIYVTDNGNHRVVKLNTNLQYVAQYGVTGRDTPTTTAPITKLCPSPFDVAVDDSGKIYITSHAHMLIQVDPTVDISTRSGYFGIFGQANTSYASTTKLRLPLGVGVDNVNEHVWVVDFGGGDVYTDRIVRLNFNMTYLGHFTPVWDTTALPRKLYDTENYAGIGDIEYSASESKWYVGIRETRLGTASTFEEHVIMKFNTTPSGTPNYADRVVLRVPYPAGFWVDANYVITGSGHDGLVIYDKSTFGSGFAPVPYETTKNSILTISHKFVSPYGISSDGTRVLVTEPSIHSVQCFDADVGVFRGVAGVSYEAGDDRAHLHGATHAMVHSDYLVICDTDNHRLLRRHISAPWVSKDGTISTMLPPATTDKIRLFYDVETYQGVFGSVPIGEVGGKEAIYKSQVKAQADFIYTTTLGLGIPLTTLYQEFNHLRGMTARLPLPYGWNDYDISPIGMKTGTSDIDDDSPYLAQPVTISEGFMGGQGNKLPYSGGNLSSRQFLQQVVRTVSGEANPLNRGYRSVLPTDVVVPRNRTIQTQILSPTIYTKMPWIITEQFFEILRPGVPPVRSNNLLEAVPHFNYYPFLYQRKGRLTMGVIAEGSSGKTVGLGVDKNVVARVDGFNPFGRILVR